MENQNLEQLQEVWNKVEFPSKLRCLFEPNRYKVLYGGRGGAKSWGIARALLVIGSKKPVRILCAREFMTSMRDSVHKLLSDQIDSLGLGFFYEVTQSNIRGKNGTEISFVGLRNNPTNVKSYEGVDVVWVEEAQTVSKTSWDVLIPTIRKEGSEIWVSFNPELETDETYQRFVYSPPDNAIVQKINWNDNPWFPETLRLEKDSLKARDIEAYNTVWEGICRKTVDGAVFAKEMQTAELEERITNVPYDPTKPVHIVFDLGWSDATAWWVLQFVGMENRLIKYDECNQTTITEIMAKIQTYGYIIDTLWLPHDAENKTLAGNGRSIEEIVRAIGYKTRIIPKMPIADSINAARTIFRNCWFDKKNCATGLQCLSHYRYEVDADTGQFSRNPLHDNYSHGADAFRYIAYAISEPKTMSKKKPHTHYNIGNSWMG
jgi:phage terminase large subunit